MAIPDKETGFRFKCGKCRRGVVAPFISASCAVCGAVVGAIDDRNWAKDGYFGTVTEIPYDAFPRIPK
jgi:hypothetical protein